MLLSLRFATDTVVKASANREVEEFFSFTEASPEIWGIWSFRCGFPSTCSEYLACANFPLPCLNHKDSDYSHYSHHDCISFVCFAFRL